MLTNKSRLVFLALLAACLALPGVSADACSTPVFRYALERWRPDALPVFLFHKGPLTAEQNKALEALRTAGGEGKANVSVEPVDLGGQVNPVLAKMWAKCPDQTLPRLVLTYAFRQRQYADVPAEALAAALPPVVFSAPVTDESVKAIVDSPARREVARRIIDGQTCVWVLLECGDAKADNEAAALLAKELARLTKELRLPDADPTGDAASEAVPGAAPALGVTSPAADKPQGPPVRIEFSILRLPAQAANAGEKVFAELLMGLERDLADAHKSQPLAFPMYGRGRALNPLVGKGISAGNIQEYCSSLTASCSCEVKAENPGTDMLFLADWDKPFANMEVTPVQLPVPSSLAGLEGQAATAPAPATPASAPAPGVGKELTPVGPTSIPARPTLRGGNMMTIVGVTLGGVVVLVLVGALLATRKPREN